MKTEDVKRAAEGRWLGILASLGLGDEYLQNKHGPCPACGGKDRYRFDGEGDRGTLYYCSGCGPGDGFSLLMKVHGWNFREAVKHVVEALGIVEEVAQPSRPWRDPRKALRELLGGCAKNRRPLLEYLQHRGLTQAPEALRYHPSCPFFEGKEKRGNYPAMIAVVNGPDGSAQSIHRTYLADLEPRKKLMPPVSTIKGGAIRLFKSEDDVLGVAEGIETALAAAELSGLPVWSTIAAANLAAFVPPSNVKKVVVFGDNDETFVGQAVAYGLARRLVVKDGLKAKVQIPRFVGTDWLDVLNNQRGETQE